MIKYDKTKWVDGTTVLRASHMEKIEKGITDIIDYNNSIYTDEDTRKSNEINRQNTFSNKISEVNDKITEINNFKENMANAVSNKMNEIETKFNELTISKQQDAEVIMARDGETSLKARLDRDIEKAKQVYVNVEGSNISTDSSVGYAKDVEIFGNTIQDASNLADIRSVGDKVEGQELYEIPVVSVGKNLFDLRYIVKGKYITDAGVLGDSGNYHWSNYIKIKPNVIYSRNNTLNLFCYDKDFKPIGNKINTATFTTPNDAKYIAFTLAKDSEPNIQLEEGTVATPYEPYQEDKLTILSPVQIEKVGDVADRIIEKDGVWGVEKNIVTVVLNGSENWDKDELGVFYINKSNWRGKPHKPVNTCISNIFGQAPSMTEVDDKIYMGNSYMFMIKPSGISTVGEWKNYLINRQLNAIYATTQPQFIPLPHSQQVKLRTFASKTNISFLTEIEGTIKAQVPKSLGATVNTHTEQINSLNKELDRVKKLEESTVSTVTTESDFTTVEATSNGYFEDVKLEGNTLVNIIQPRGNWNTVNDITCYRYFKLIKPLEVGKTYTYFYFNLPNSIIDIYLGDDAGKTPLINWTPIKNIHSFVATETMITLNEVTPHFRTNGTNKFTLDEFNNVNLVLLEGDHTQNPPSYFEGLMSVGEDSEEIEVLSRKEDGNLFDINEGFDWTKTIRIEDGKVVLSGVTTGTHNVRKLMKLSPNTKYTISIKAEGNQGGTVRGSVDKNASWHNDLFNLSYDVTSKTFTTPNDGIINIGFVCDANKTTKVWDIKIEKGQTVTEYIPHQSDKKRLLYYNNETQTWEKPILRQWDSIEKHADGKYYYHKRSGEVVLNGSESWKEGSPAQFTDTHMFFACNSFDKIIKTEAEVISDKFVYGATWDILSRECIDSTTETSKLRIRISKSKLSTQDVAGFKQWLQANPVTVVYQLAQEKVYECTNIDLITYANETNYIVNSGAIVPRTTLKVHNNISNVVSLLQKKVSLLESNIKASQEVQDMMILETDMRMLDIELALMDFMPMTLNLGGSNMLRSTTYFNFLKNHIINETYEKEYLENVMNKYLATGRINQDEYNELYKMLYPPVYDIELPIEY